MIRSKRFQSRLQAMRRGSLSRNLLFVVGILAVVGVIALAVMRGGAGVDVIHPYRGDIRQSFREPARTRLEQTWTISLQVPARIGRIDLEPGDRVKKGQTLVEVDLLPVRKTVEEAEARAERLKAQLRLIRDVTVEEAELSAAQARAQGSLEQLAAAEAQVESAAARVERTRKELERMESLIDFGAIDERSVDDARLAATEAAEALSQARSYLEAQRSTLEASRQGATQVERTIQRRDLTEKEVLAQLEEAEAQLERARHDLQVAPVVSPVDATVLERYTRGEAPVPQGAELLLLGRPDEIEVVADILTEDALRLEIGDEVALESLGGERLMTGAVMRIEPQGFTKLSSLGVEQQRVNAIVGLKDPPPDLGVGYRLYARFFTGSRENALLLTRFSILQSPDGEWYVYVVEGGRLRRRNIDIGFTSDLEIEVVEGLSEEDLVVASPETTLEEGQAVSPQLQEAVRR